MERRDGREFVKVRTRCNTSFCDSYFVAIFYGRVVKPKVSCRADTLVRTRARRSLYIKILFLPGAHPVILLDASAEYTFRNILNYSVNDSCRYNSAFIYGYDACPIPYTRSFHCTRNVKPGTVPIHTSISPGTPRIHRRSCIATYCSRDILSAVIRPFYGPRQTTLDE